MTKTFTEVIGTATFVWQQADPVLLQRLCLNFAQGDSFLIDLALMVDRTIWVTHIIFAAAVSTLLQQLIVLRVAKNSQFSQWDFWINVAVLASSGNYLHEWYKGNRNDMIPDFCEEHGSSYFEPSYA